MHKKNIFITLLFFAFSWGWSNNSALDTVYHKAADASVPDTIYVIESSTESELAPTETDEPIYNAYTPIIEENTKNEKMFLFFHPISLLYGLGNEEFMGFVTIEKEMNRNTSLIFRPQVIYQELSLYDDDWSGSTPNGSYSYGDVSFHQTQIKMSVGIKRYNRIRQGYFLQVNGGLGFGHCKSIDSEENKKKFLYATGSVSSTIGKTWKTKHFATFLDLGVGLKLSTVDYDDNETFEDLFFVEFGNAFYFDMNVGIGFNIN